MPFTRLALSCTCKPGPFPLSSHSHLRDDQALLPIPLPRPPNSSSHDFRQTAPTPASALRTLPSLLPPTTTTPRSQLTASFRSKPVTSLTHSSLPPPLKAGPFLPPLSRGVILAPPFLAITGQLAAPSSGCSRNLRLSRVYFFSKRERACFQPAGKRFFQGGHFGAGRSLQLPSA